MTGVTVLYARVDDGNHAWLKRQSAVTGIPIATLIDALVGDARAQGVTFIRSTDVTVRRERKEDEAAAAARPDGGGGSPDGQG